MSDVKSAESRYIDIRIELFGMARIRSGCSLVDLAVPEKSGMAEVVAALATACPRLVCNVILEDGHGLLESYVFNVNGAFFASNGVLGLNSGDSVLLFASQAGG